MSTIVFMSLRRKAFIFILTLCAVLISSVIFISRTIILNNFTALEQENTRQNLDRVKNAIDDKINALDTFTQDYAGWNDTYEFIQDGNQEYIDSNLIDETFAGTKINMMVFINRDKEIAFSKMYDQELKQALPLTNDFKQYLSDNSPLLSHPMSSSMKSGIILLNKDPMLVVSRPILTSEKKGPIRGSLIMGKFIGKEVLEDLKSTTKLDLSLLRPGETKEYPDLKSGQLEYIHPVSGETILGYRQLLDINGKPAVTIKITLPRTIYTQGKQAMYYLVGSLVFLSLLLAVISVIYIDRILLTPLKRLVTDVNNIRTNADFSIRVHEAGEGEFSELAKDINRMTTALASGEKALRVVNKEIEFEKENIEKIVQERTQELSAEQARFIASINSVLEGFILLDTDGKVVMTNHVISHIFNTEHKDWSFDQIKLTLSDAFDFELAYRQCLNEKKSTTYDNLNFKDKILKIFFAPVFMAPRAGNLTGIVVILEDITEAKKLERSKDEFFSIASHELRTPLTAIKGNTQMMQKYFSKKIDDKDFTAMLNDLYLSSIRLIDIVNVFLTTSRLEQGKVEFDIKPFDINGLLLQVVKRMQTTAQAKGLTLDYNDSLAPIFAVADPNRTEEVILNLISNAINYTEKGGVTIKLKVVKNEVVVSVEDTGKGIPEKDQPLLFRKFQQLNEDLYTRDVSRGTGLGLYISRLMIDAMKGKIYIERSEVYKGSVFTFTLPLKKYSTKSYEENNSHN